MKRKNHYIWATILWAISTVAFAVASVVNFVNGTSAIGLIWLCVSVGFAFLTGILFQNACEIAKFNRQQAWLHDFAESMKQLAEETEKLRKKEIGEDPFAEFINESAVPFPEVEKKEKTK